MGIYTSKLDDRQTIIAHNLSTELLSSIAVVCIHIYKYIIFAAIASQACTQVRSLISRFTGTVSPIGR